MTATAKTVARCTRCGLTKALDDFPPEPRKNNGRGSHCRLCKSAAARARWPSEEAGLLSRARTRAREKGVPFDLTEEDIRIPDACPVLSIPLFSPVPGTGIGPSECSPSLDRIIPALGYVRGNVRVISQRANRIKNDATLDELKALVRWLEEHHAP